MGCKSSSNGASIQLQWIPRESNTQADNLSKMTMLRDTDQWEVTDSLFTYLDQNWGPHTVDRFASNRNSKCAKFNSRNWCTGTQSADAFSASWRYENNWLVPPIKLVLKVLNKLQKEHANGTLVVPKWKSAPYWPVLFPNREPAEFIQAVECFEAKGNILFEGKSHIFNRKQTIMLALRIDFSV